MMMMMGEKVRAPLCSSFCETGYEDDEKKGDKNGLKSNLIMDSPVV